MIAESCHVCSGRRFVIGNFAGDLLTPCPQCNPCGKPMLLSEYSASPGGAAVTDLSRAQLSAIQEELALLVVNVIDGPSTIRKQDREEMLKRARFLLGLNPWQDGASKIQLEHNFRYAAVKKAFWTIIQTVNPPDGEHQAKLNFFHSIVESSQREGS